MAALLQSVRGSRSSNGNSYLFIYNTTNCTNTKKTLTNNNNITNNNTRFIAILKTSQFWLTTLSSSLTYLALKTMADWTFVLG